MKTIKHQLDSKNKRIYFLHKTKENTLGKASKHFTASQKSKAKANHKRFKTRHPFAYKAEREQLLKFLATIRETPNLNLKIYLTPQ